jgi:hypothetical protein
VEFKFEYRIDRKGMPKLVTVAQQSSIDLESGVGLAEEESRGSRWRALARPDQRDKVQYGRWEVVRSKRLYAGLDRVCVMGRFLKLLLCCVHVMPG